MKPPRFEDDEDFDLEPEHKKNYSTPVLIGIIFILIVGMGGFFLFNSLKDSSQNSDNASLNTVTMAESSSDYSQEAEEGESDQKDSEKDSENGKNDSDFTSKSSEQSSSSESASIPEIISIEENDKQVTSSSSNTPSNSQIQSSVEPEEVPVVEQNPVNTVNPSVIADEYILPQSSTTLISYSDLSGLNAQQLNYARNEIYARHGRMFNSSELQSYFNSKDWYTPIYSPDSFSETLLNNIEKANIQTLKDREWELYPGGYPVK